MTNFSCRVNFVKLNLLTQCACAYSVGVEDRKGKTMYTFTPEQDAVIVARWNEIADDAAQLRPGQAHLVVGDNFDADMADYGAHLVEVSVRYSKTGDATAFHIADDEVTFDG